MNKHQETYQKILLNEIFPDPDQPRRVFDPDAMEELASSIREHGVIQPISVYRNGRGYVIKHGERRWRASRLAGQETIPAVVGEAPDALTNRLQQFVENDQREGLNLIEQARFYRDMIEVEGLSRNELSRRLGKGGQTAFITGALIWLELEDEIQTAVAAGRLHKDHRVARALLSIPDSAARVKLAVALAERKASISACIAAADGMVRKLAATKENRVKAPAISLGLNGQQPSADAPVKWDDVRKSARMMCDLCSLKGIADHPEPAWSLVLESAESVCSDCAARNGRDLLICRECPGVAMIRRLAEVVTG